MCGSPTRFPHLYPGIDYAAHALDPEGHCIQLYYYMEQIGWDGKPRPKELRRKASADWPEVLEPLSDTYADQLSKGLWASSQLQSRSEDPHPMHR